MPSCLDFPLVGGPKRPPEHMMYRIWYMVCVWCIVYGRAPKDHIRKRSPTSGSSWGVRRGQEVQAKCALLSCGIWPRAVGGSKKWIHLRALESTP